MTQPSPVTGGDRQPPQGLGHHFSCYMFQWCPLEKKKKKAWFLRGLVQYGPRIQGPSFCGCFELSLRWRRRAELQGCHMELDPILSKVHSYEPPWAEEQGAKELETQTLMTTPQYQPASTQSLAPSNLFLLPPSVHQACAHCRGGGGDR